jgi:hypothetical protein
VHTLEEICQITDLTMTNPKTKLYRARQRLKVIVENNFAAELVCSNPKQTWTITLSSPTK